MGIYEKLSAIQQELKAPKGQYNSFGKYKYRSCEDILEAVKPICAKHKTTLVLLDSISEVNGRFYVTARAQLHDCESDNAVTATAYAREPEKKTGMDESQITGTASSYARKYALNGLFCIDDTKDADTDEYKQQERKDASGKPPKGKPEGDAGKSNDESYSPQMCMRCGQEITAALTNDGKLWRVADMVKFSKKRYGKQMCAECMKITEAGM